MIAIFLMSNNITNITNVKETFLSLKILANIRYPLSESF